jgi:hypothetical protein
VKIALGTDSGVFPHGKSAHEFELMVGLGMKPMDAILAGTKNAATLLASKRHSAPWRRGRSPISSPSTATRSTA